MSGTGIAYNPDRERKTTPFNGTGDVPPALQKARDSAIAEPFDNQDEEDEGGTILNIHEDGSVSVEVAAPAVKRPRNTDDFNENLAETLPDSTLSAIAQDYLDGVSSDIMSRSQFISNYNKGIDLLGLKIEDASSTRGSRQSISRAKHPGLLKACVRSQSLARGGLLPPEGPVKVATVGDSTGAEDDMARQFQSDFNYYLTEVAEEYYPDTDRMLFYRAFGGSAFKKIYRCPIRRRPVSESINLDSFIVSEDVTDLHNATRKTNEIIVSPTLMKKMQHFGGWRDVHLAMAMPDKNQARRKILESQGLAPVSTRPQDQDFTTYEGYWSVDPRDYGFNDPNAPEGLPLPYKVVLDSDSQQVLALHRNWRKQDTEFFRERQVFVKYGLVPGLGFLDYGFLHLIGNQTRVLTAAWQILVDKGMLANAPGGLKVKGVRAASNELNPGLGEWVDVDIGNIKKIQDALMAMPYGDISPQFIELVRDLEQDIEKMSGTIEIETGGNRTNMPVGTILAMIEQQAQDLTAVHQRDHRAQAKELKLLRDLFVEHPEDLKWVKGRRSNTDWTKLVKEFSEFDLVPASDPNVPSQTHRIMINQFLMQIAQAAPMLFGSKIRKVAQRIITSVGIADADSLLASDEEIQAAQAAQAQGAQKGKGGGAQGGAGAASMAKAQLELPLKQQQIAVEERRVALEEQENQREAANQAADHQQRDEDQAAKERKDELEAQIDQARLASEHVRGLADSVLENTNTPEDEANLRKTNAQAFAAMGSGAMGFAKAGEVVKQGEEDLSGLNTDLAEGSSKRRLQRPKARRTTRGTASGTE